MLFFSYTNHGYRKYSLLRPTSPFKCSHALLLHSPLFFCTLHFAINFAPICNGCPSVITVALIKLPQFLTAFALISNNTKLSQFVTKTLAPICNTCIFLILSSIPHTITFVI